MLLWTNPEVTVTPPTQVADFLDFRVIVLFVVFDGQVSRVIHAHVAAESEQDTTDFECEKFGIRSGTTNQLMTLGNNRRTIHYLLRKLPYRTNTFSLEPVL